MTDRRVLVLFVMDDRSTRRARAPYLGANVLAEEARLAQQFEEFAHGVPDRDATVVVVALA